MRFDGGNAGLEGNGAALRWADLAGCGDDNSEYATITDVTGAFAQLNLQGPFSRSILEHAICGSEDFDGSAFRQILSNESFPFRAVKELYLGFAKVIVTRITYVGELGYEIFVPAEQATHVLELLHNAAKKVGKEKLDKILDSDGGKDSGKDCMGKASWAQYMAENGVPYAGLKALGSLRMEKGYRDYGHDIDNTDSLAEAGLSFTADLNKVTLKEANATSSAFNGSDSVVAAKAAGVKKLSRRLVQVLLTQSDGGDEDKDTGFMFHGEVLMRDGQVVGDIRAASYGHSLGGAVGLAMVSELSKINS